MGEYHDLVEWASHPDPQRKRSGSAVSVLGSVFGFSASTSGSSISSSSEVFSASTYSSRAVPPPTQLRNGLPSKHRRLRSHSQSAPLEDKAKKSPPSMRLAVQSHQPHSSYRPAAPTVPLYSPVAADNEVTSSRLFTSAPHSTFHFRKLPRAYRSPSPNCAAPVSLADRVEYLTTASDSSAPSISYPPLSHSLLMSALQSSNDSRSRSKSNNRLISTLKARGVSGLGSSPASSSAPISQDNSPSATVCGSPASFGDNDADKPPPSSSFYITTGVALPSPSARGTTPIPTPSSKANKRSNRYSFQLLNRPGSSSSEAAQSSKQGQRFSKSSPLRRRDKPRGESFTAKLEIESQSGHRWDEESDTAKTMTILPRWKAAFGRARGKSIEGQVDPPPSSPFRRNGLASRSQPDLTRLQKLLRDGANSESMSIPTSHSSLSYNGARTKDTLDSPLIMAAREERDRFAPATPANAKRYDSVSKGQRKYQAGSYTDTLPLSSPRMDSLKTKQVSSDQSLSSQAGDGTPLQPRLKRSKFLRRPGTTQGPYSAPSTPSVPIRPGTSGESSSRAPFHPASDPVINKRLRPIRLKTSPSAYRPSTSDQITPSHERSGQLDWSRSGRTCEIRLEPVTRPERPKVEMATASRTCNSPLLQVLRPEVSQRPAMSPDSISSPLFDTLKEESQSARTPQAFLLSPAQIEEIPRKRVSSNVKVKELRRTMKALEEAMALSTEGQQGRDFYDTPRSSVSRFTEALSSAGPATPYSNRSSQSITSAHTFFRSNADRESAGGSSAAGGMASGLMEKMTSSEGVEQGQDEEDSLADEAGDQTIVPAIAYEEDRGARKQLRISQQKSIFEQYCQEHPVGPSLLPPGEKRSRRSTTSEDSRAATVMCSTDSSASFSLDAEFWLVKEAEKRVIKADTAKPVIVGTEEVHKEVEAKERAEDSHDISISSSRPSADIRDEERTILESKGVRVSEEDGARTLRVELQFECPALEGNNRGMTAGKVLLTSTDIEAIGRAWLRGKTSRLSLLSLTSVREGEALQNEETFPNSIWLDEQRALEQRQTEILRTSSDVASVIRVHSAPAFIRRTISHSKSLTTDSSSSSSRKKWQRKALVLAPRIPSDQPSAYQEPLRSDGSSRRYLVSPQTTASSSRPSSPSTELRTPKLRLSRSPMGPAPLAYKRSVSSFSNEQELSRSLPAT